MTPPTSFSTLTGNKPFPWQHRLLNLWAGADFSNDVLRLETGTGKTSAIAIWLAALLENPDQVPRRLVYVVNRRTVVDQTTSEIEAISKRLHGTELDSKLRELSVLSLPPDESALTISALRGQLADNRLWSADPARPAVIVGTVDMIGSRLLFAGYGIGWKTQPLHAGFLGQDTLIIHDECHLEPAFQVLLETIKNAQHQSPRPPKLIALSATPREGQGNVFELDEADYKNPVLKKRLTALKQLSVQKVNSKKDLPDAITKKALSFASSKLPVLVFSNTVELATKIAKGLAAQKHTTKMLTGTMRGLERDNLVNDPAFQRFLPAYDSANEDTVYLIATSAGEVGVNLSCAHLICDLVPFERMAQRLGRLNRFGEYSKATVDVFHTDDLDDPRQETLELLHSLDGDASPSKLAKLDPDARDSASTALPKMLPATDVLFDSQSMTTIRDLPTKPDSLDPYLHGIVDKDLPRTTVAWREEVDLLNETTVDGFDPTTLIESFRLKPHETLSDGTHRVLKELNLLAKNKPDTPVWLVDRSGNVDLKILDEILDKQILEHRTILLPPSIGGLSPVGTLDGKKDAPKMSLDVSCRYEERLRRWETEWPGQDWNLIKRIYLNDDDTDNAQVWSWYEKAWGGDGNGQQTSKLVLLEDHQNDVASLARAMAQSLGFEPEVCEALEFAGKKHDSGKSRRTWQAAAGNTDGSPHIAKPLERSFSAAGFRHELASLIDLQSDLDFGAFSNFQRDLIQHLIAVHHGRARPMFAKKELFDPETPRQLVDEVARHIPHRFARLQEQYGHWGLAYIESILRAADYAASAGRQLKAGKQ
jgi:CRISPR-associated endonuclease/helicase Cas3